MHKSPCQYLHGISSAFTSIASNPFGIHKSLDKSWGGKKKVKKDKKNVIASNLFSLHTSLDKCWEREREKKRQKEQKCGAQKLTCPEYAWSPRTLCTLCPSPLFSAPPCGAPQLAACSHRQRTVVLHETSSCPGSVHAQVLFNKCNGWQNGKREKN